MFLPLSLSFPVSYLSIKNNSKGLRSTLMALSFSTPGFFFICFFLLSVFLGSELRNTEKRHNDIVLWYFDIKGKRYLILVEC